MITVTPVGAVLLAVMLYFLTFGRKHFIWFLSAMIPFSQTAMVIVAGQGVSPFYVAAIFATLMGIAAVIRNLYREKLSFRPFRGVESVLLFAFAVYASFITLIGPRLFEGIGVISVRGSVSAQIDSPTPLEFTVSNLAQLAYMLLGVGVVLFVMSQPKLSPRMLEPGIWAGLGITAINAALLAVGRPFPRELFDTIPTIYYQQGGRLRGIFAEPSVLGAFLVGAAAYLVIRVVRARGVGRIIPAVGLALAGWEFFLSTSGTVFAAGAVLAALGLAVFVLKWIRAGLRHLEIVSLTVLVALIGLLWKGSVVFEFLDNLVGDKLVSNSLEARTGADELAYEIFFSTNGIGVGLGSNRPSGFIAMMLSCVGFIGTATFLLLIVICASKIIRKHAEFAGSAWALLGVTIALSIAKADLGTPLLWMALGACMWVTQQRTAVGGVRKTTTDRRLGSSDSLTTSAVA